MIWSELPLASTIFAGCVVSVVEDGWESARHRMADAWALNRNVSAKSTVPCFSGNVAVTPCNIFSYVPTTIWMVVDGPLDTFFLGSSGSFGTIFVFESPFSSL